MSDKDAPLGPRTVHQYERILTRACGSTQPPFELRPEVQAWKRSQVSLLRAALYRYAGEAFQGLAEQLPKATHAVKRTLWIPTESELLAYEQAALRRSPSERALAIIPLYLGLRADEVLGITRDAVQHAVKTGQLLVLRKGAEQQYLPAKGVHEHLQAMLDTPAKPGRAMLDRPTATPRAWRYVGELLSPGKRSTQYQLFFRLVRSIGEEASIRGVANERGEAAHARPHLLRHGFATRMFRDGAPMELIQRMLNHKRVSTTLRYVHLEMSDAEKWLRAAPK